MIILWKQGSEELAYNDKVIPCSCNVRNELNGLRQPDQVIRTMPNGHPYMPRIFPKGEWLVYMPEARTQLDRAPFFIPTNAFQRLPIWELEDGKYKAPAPRLDRDSGYGLHYSVYATTLGCIKIKNLQDLMDLVDAIKAAIAKGEIVKLVVE